jgi:hypothetical protein
MIDINWKEYLKGFSEGSISFSATFNPETSKEIISLFKKEPITTGIEIELILNKTILYYIVLN